MKCSQKHFVCVFGLELISHGLLSVLISLVVNQNLRKSSNSITRCFVHVIYSFFVNTRPMMLQNKL